MEKISDLASSAKKRNDFIDPTYGIKIKPILYPALYWLYTLFVNVLYSTVSVVGVHHVPPEGTPTIIAFNHGNGHLDPMLTMASTPRLVRVCAKNTLWTTPFWGWFVRNMGSVPVFRAIEHGDKTRELNEKTTFRAAIKMLLDGQCVGIAPEGISRFTPDMAQFKTGMARFAMRAVENSTDPNFKVYIVPMGISYTHREKFRSSVVVEYSEPIIIDKSWLAPSTITDQSAREEYFRMQGHKITDLAREKMMATTLAAPDFTTGRLAMTATRVRSPLGTRASLHDYVQSIRNNMRLLSADVEKGSGNKITELREALRSYQDLLDQYKVKDERIRRYTFGNQWGCLWRIVLILFRLVTTFILFVLVTPGLLVWSPMWWLFKRGERQVMTKGPLWADKIMEKKTQIGFILLATFLIFVPVACVLVFGLFWINLRLFEEFTASARSLNSHWKLLFLKRSVREEMLARRRIVLELLKNFPEVKGMETTDVGRKTVIRSWPWSNWGLCRRYKKDWNEVLRLDDINTFDYVSIKQGWMSCGSKSPSRISAGKGVFEAKDNKVDVLVAAATPA